MTSEARPGWMMRTIDAWPLEWRQLVHEYGFIDVERMRTEKHSVKEARTLLAERRRRIDALVR